MVISLVVVVFVVVVVALIDFPSTFLHFNFFNLSYESLITFIISFSLHLSWHTSRNKTCFCFAFS